MFDDILENIDTIKDWSIISAFLKLTWYPCSRFTSNLCLPLHGSNPLLLKNLACLLWQKFPLWLIRLPVQLMYMTNSYKFHQNFDYQFWEIVALHKEKFDFVSHVFKTSILVGWQLVFKTFPPSLSLFLSFLYRTGCHSFLLFFSPPPKNYLPILLKIVFLSHSLDDAVRHVFVLYCSRPIICSYGAARLQGEAPTTSHILD